jgi:hypothetical protein
LEYAQQLEAAGMPRAQAEVVAKGLTAMFIHNFDTLVTKDYLDTRFSAFEARIDLRFADMESRTDRRFAESESRMNQRFAGMDLHFADLESRMDLRLAGMETRFARVNVLLGVILAALAIPVLQTVLLWVR